MNGIESTAAKEAVMVMMCILLVGDARFCIEANRICEVLGELPWNPVPLAPEYIDGVVAYRGEVLTAVSLRALLNIETNGKRCVVILKDYQAEERFALVVDAVEGLTMFPRDTVEPNPGSLDAQSMYLFDGHYRTSSALMVRIDIKQLEPSRIAQSGLFDQAAHERSWRPQ